VTLPVRSYNAVTDIFAGCIFELLLEGSSLALIAVCVMLAQKGKRKRSRPSTASNTPVKDCSNDVSEPVKEEEETPVTQEEAGQPVVATVCEPKPAEEQTAPDSSVTVSVTPLQPAVKEKPSKTSKDRSDRKRERRKERKSESGSPAVLTPDRASPVCNGTAADDMNVCK